MASVVIYARVSTEEEQDTAARSAFAGSTQNVTATPCTRSTRTTPAPSTFAAARHGAR